MSESGVIVDEVLGTLTRFRSLEMWICHRQLLGVDDFAVTVSAERAERPVGELVLFAREVIAFIERNDQLLRSTIVDQFLTEYNEVHKWPEDEPDLTRDEFLQKLCPSGVVIETDYSHQIVARISYSCKGLFGERLPIVHLDLEKRIVNVTVE